MLFAHLKRKDPLKRDAEKLLRKVCERELRVEASSEVVNEVVIWHKSHGYSEKHIRTILGLVSAIPITYIPLTPEIAISASVLAEKYGLSYFDSYHAATALSRPDRTIISSNGVFDKLPGLRRLPLGEVGTG